MTDKRDADLLNVGKQCSHSICGLVDFLPFNCQHCNKSFCQEHFKVEAHSCEKYDETKFNRVAPDCPLCKMPIAIRPEEDPNIRMNRHIDTECSVMTGKPQKSSSSPHCAQARCRKPLFPPIQCNACRQQFCLSHRFPEDHACTPQPAKDAPRVARPPHNSNFLAKFDSTAKKLMQSTSTTMRAPSAPAANVASTSTSDPPATAASSSKLKVKLPFSKADRRAKDEKASRRKAMKVRAEKGLLSEKEKAILAAEEAADDQKDCLLM